MKSNLIKSYVIHTKKLNNSNLLIYLLTEDFGLIKVFYNQNPKAKHIHLKQSLLQPFQMILENINNKKKQIIYIEEYLDNHNLKSSNNSYFYKIYLNELVYLCYKNYNHDPNSELFKNYQIALDEIKKNDDASIIKKHIC